LLAAVALGALLLVGGCWWFTRRLTRPLSQLRTMIEAQYPGQPEAPMPPPLSQQTSPEVAAIDDAYRKLLARTQAHDSERALLLAGISHDLRGPLARIRAAAEMLPDSLALAPRRDSIVRNVMVADALIESFLDHVRAGELPMDERCNVAAIARAVALRGEHAIGDLLLEMPAKVWVEHNNAQLIERAITNLVDNAFAHGKPPVRLRVSASSRTATIEVADHGDGIAPAFRVQLCKPSRAATRRVAARVPGWGWPSSPASPIAQVGGWNSAKTPARACTRCVCTCPSTGCRQADASAFSKAK
jgi:two-component system osmolarity sensor histidine kinase EnvZ